VADVDKVVWNPGTRKATALGQRVIYKHSFWIRTKHKDADDDRNGQDEAIQSVDSLVHVVHTRVDRLALSGILGHCKNHLFKTDVAISIAVDRSKLFFGFLLTIGTQGFQKIVLVKFIVAFNNKRHPDTFGEGFGALVFF
jgi:hypothetical protein